MARAVGVCGCMGRHRGMGARPTEEETAWDSVWEWGASRKMPRSLHREQVAGGLLPVVGGLEVSRWGRHWVQQGSSQPLGLEAGRGE